MSAHPQPSPLPDVPASPAPRLVGQRASFLVFGKPALGPEESAEVLAVLESGWLGTGPRVARFESDFAAYKGGGHAVGLNSCTAALHLALLASGVGPGDEVITTALTFGATVNAIIHAGASPVLADVDPITQCIDPASVEAKISPRTAAIVPVHFAGRPCDMDALSRIAERHGLLIIEDCAHAIETTYHDRPAGTFGRFGCFSFYATKNLTTGEGGMVLCADEQDAERIRHLSLHGLSRDAWDRFGNNGYRHYAVIDAGYKYNMMDLQAAIGIHQLAKIETHWRRRMQIAVRYDAAFADLPIDTPAVPEAHTRNAHHLYPLRIDPLRCGVERDAFLQAMKAQNIGVGVHYLAIPEHPYYQDRFGWRPDDTPHATRIGRETASIPLAANLTDDDVEDVIAAVRFALEK
jgi:dTDP-4-amino-4,6-dideoxygalactose transaminase